jgi:hypothetical protein
MEAHAYQPVYHLYDPNGWVNDPNGPLYHKGQYHMYVLGADLVRDPHCCRTAQHNAAAVQAGIICM